MTRLAVHIHQLTQPHLSNGEHQPPLLTRLRAATTPGNDGASAGGDSGNPVPINLSAVDLLLKIEMEARDEYRHYRRLAYVGSLESLLRDLTGTPWTELPEDWEQYLTDKASGWIDAIMGLLYPKKPRRRLHQPCPACGVKYHGPDRLPSLTLNCWDEHEDMMPPAKWDASCEACGAEWHGDEVQWLSRTLVNV